MKFYPYISKIMFAISLIGVVLLIINCFKDIINEALTPGATFICFLTMLIVMIVTSPFKLKKSKK